MVHVMCTTLLPSDCQTSEAHLRLYTKFGVNY